MFSLIKKLPLILNTITEQYNILDIWGFMMNIGSSVPLYLLFYECIYILYKSHWNEWGYKISQ